MDNLFCVAAGIGIGYLWKKWLYRRMDTTGDRVNRLIPGFLKNKLVVDEDIANDIDYGHEADLDGPIRKQILLRCALIIDQRVCPGNKIDLTDIGRYIKESNKIYESREERFLIETILRIDDLDIVKHGDLFDDMFYAYNNIMMDALMFCSAAIAEKICDDPRTFHNYKLENALFRKTPTGSLEIIPGKCKVLLEGDNRFEIHWQYKSIDDLLWSINGKLIWNFLPQAKTKYVMDEFHKIIELCTKKYYMEHIHIINELAREIVDMTGIDRDPCWIIADYWQGEVVCRECRVIHANDFPCEYWKRHMAHHEDSAFTVVFHPSMDLEDLMLRLHNPNFTIVVR